MSNLYIWDAVRQVPENAQKPISGGRLKGMTDINPMWRIKALTEQFGVCGIGWKYEIVEKKLESGANGEIAAFVDINLFIKVEGEWSSAIPGTGGSSFVANESKGLYVSDECFKMALTDAISVSCKALGFGANTYWNKDKSKYDKQSKDSGSPEQKTSYPSPSKAISEPQLKRLYAIGKSHGVSSDDILKVCQKTYQKEPKDLNKTEYDALCARLEAKKVE